MTESRSGETCRPQTSASSPVLTTTLSADGSSEAASPRRSLAAPVPPASATTRMAYSVPVRETEERHGFAGGASERRDDEERHGFCRGASERRDDEERHGFCRGASERRGVWGPYRGPHYERL